ncbi:MAG: hypothetical protein AB7I50_18305, partial [Vicinamibacterales bacterium]
MNRNYDDYRRALNTLRDLPAQTAADLERAKQTQSHAAGLADQAVKAADATATSALGFVESQLSAARSALEPLSMSNLVPPQIRASATEATATRDDVSKAQAALAQAVNQLRQAVQDHIQRQEAENERKARDASERERLAREAAQRAAAAAELRNRMIRIAAVAALALLLLIVIL